MYLFVLYDTEYNHILLNNTNLLARFELLHPGVMLNPFPLRFISELELQQVIKEHYITFKSDIKQMLL